MCIFEFSKIPYKIMIWLATMNGDDLLTEYFYALLS